MLASDGASHGVFDAVAGIDCRLSQFFSLRFQVVDYVTGRDPDGIPGRNHLLPLVGLVFHGK